MGRGELTVEQRTKHWPPPKGRALQVTHQKEQVFGLPLSRHRPGLASPEDDVCAGVGLDQAGDATDRQRQDCVLERLHHLACLHR